MICAVRLLIRDYNTKRSSPVHRALLADPSAPAKGLAAAERSSFADIDRGSTGGRGNNGVDKQYQA